LRGRSSRVVQQMALALVLALPSTVRAHGIPVDVAFWGHFPADAAQCQRMLSRAAAVCARQALRAHFVCLEAAMAGSQCVPAALEEEVAAVEQDAAQRVAAACTELAQVQTLRFIDIPEVLTDVRNTCRELDAFAAATVYGPAMVPSPPDLGDDTVRTCIANAARSAAKLLWFAVRAQRRAFDQIATIDLNPSAKRALLERARRRIAAAQERTRAYLEARCPADDFDAIYRRQPRRILETIAQRADCFAERVYIQSTVTCPIAVCGNGIAEPGETCDDGNDHDDDSCPSDCMRRP